MMMLDKMFSPMLRLAVLIAVTVVGAEAKKKAMLTAAAKISRDFKKAMTPRSSLRPERSRLQKNILSKAKRVGGQRKLEENEWEQFGFDITQYSMKYTGCASVMAYSDELAEDEESPTVFKRQAFALFRLCPTQYCNKYSVTGCTFDYGEYVVSMEDYLEALGESFREKEEQFCEYCRPCMEDEDDDGNRRRLDEDAEVCDEDVCVDYSMCEEVEYDDDAAQQQADFELQEFFGCERVDYGDDDNQELYVGPYCDSDGFSIKLGIYEDEYCSSFVDDDVATYTGITVDEDELALYSPKDCMSCLEYEEDWQKEDRNGDDDNAEEEEEDRVAEFCERIYESSGKCNENFENLNDDDAYIAYEQVANEQAVCTYIETLQSGTYNEEGEITIDADADWFFNASNWKNSEEYLKSLKHATAVIAPWQVFALAASLIGCFVMWIWACCLHSALSRKNIPWRPRRGKDVDPGDISRQNSGIVMGRSRSGPNTTPLI